MVIMRKMENFCRRFLSFKSSASVDVPDVFHPKRNRQSFRQVENMNKGKFQIQISQILELNILSHNIFSEFKLWQKAKKLTKL